MMIFSFSKFRNCSVSSYFVLIIVMFRFTVLEFSPFRMLFLDCSQAFAISVGTFLDSISVNLALWYVGFYKIGKFNYKEFSGF